MVALVAVLAHGERELRWQGGRESTVSKRCTGSHGRYGRSRSNGWISVVHINVTVSKTLNISTVFVLSFCLYICISIPLCLSLYIAISISISIHLYLYLCIYIFIYLYRCIDWFMFLCPRIDGSFGVETRTCSFLSIVSTIIVLSFPRSGMYMQCL